MAENDESENIFPSNFKHQQGNENMNLDENDIETTDNSFDLLIKEENHISDMDNIDKKGCTAAEKSFHDEKNDCDVEHSAVQEENLDDEETKDEKIYFLEQVIKTLKAERRHYTSGGLDFCFPLSDAEKIEFGGKNENDIKTEKLLDDGINNGNCREFSERVSDDSFSSRSIETSDVPEKIPEDSINLRNIRTSATPEENESFNALEESVLDDENDDTSKDKNGCPQDESSSSSESEEDEMSEDDDDRSYAAIKIVFPDIEDDDSYDIFEREQKHNEFVAQMSDKPYTNYEGAAERNRERYLNQLATGELEDNKFVRICERGRISAEERERRELYALDGAKHLLQVSKRLISCYKKGKVHNIAMGRRILMNVYNYAFSPLMVVYVYPLVEIIIKLTYYRFDSLTRKIARRCFTRLKPMFPIPFGKTFLQVLREEVRKQRVAEPSCIAVKSEPFVER